MNAGLSLRLLAVGILAFAPTASAAVVSVSSAASADTDYDLTNVYGLGDWAYWENNAGDDGAPLNRKSGGNLIGPMSILNTDGTLSGSTSSNRPVHDFAFTDGVSPVSGSIDDVIGLFNAPTESLGNGLAVSVTSPTSDPFTIYVWAAAYNAEARLTATVGAESDSGNFSTPSTNERIGRLYTVSVTPDSVGQAVTLALDMVVNKSGTASHVSLAAVAVDTPIPEPATMSLSLLGGMLMLSRRRRA